MIIKFLQIALFTVAIALSLRAQSNWLIGAGGSVDCCFMRHAYGSASNKQHYKALNDDETGFGYKAGFGVMYTLSKDWSLETGIIVTRFSYQNRSPDGSSPPKIISVVSRHNSTYITLPVRVGYSVGDRDLRFVGSAGMLVGYSLLRNLKRSYRDDADNEVMATIRDRNGLPTFELDIQVSAGFSYKPNKVEYRLLPAFRTSIFGNEFSNSKIFPCALGLNFGAWFMI